MNFVSYLMNFWNGKPFLTRSIDIKAFESLQMMSGL